MISRVKIVHGVARQGRSPKHNFPFFKPREGRQSPIAQRGVARGTHVRPWRDFGFNKLAPLISSDESPG
jgi:hypothetical protein